jgi:hypothetical protein
MCLSPEVMSCYLLYQSRLGAFCVFNAFSCTEVRDAVPAHKTEIAELSISKQGTMVATAS